MKRSLAAACVAALVIAGRIQAQPSDFDALAPVVDAAIARHELPGAVVLAGKGDAIVYRHAFGQRALPCHSFKRTRGNTAHFTSGCASRDE